MQKEEQTRIVENILGMFKHQWDQKLDKIPENWDGHEIAEYIAYLARCNTGTISKKRKREMTNDIIVKNL